MAQPAVCRDVICRGKPCDLAGRMLGMLSRVATSASFERPGLQPSTERIARGSPAQARIELRRLSDAPPAATQPARARIVLPVETGATQSSSQAPAGASALDPSAIAAMIAQLGNPTAFADQTLAGSARNALQTLASVYGGETSGRVYEAISHWMQIAAGLARPSASPAPATSAPPSAPAVTGTATQSTARAQSSTRDLDGTAVPYDQLPARMRGGTSSGNGMPIIIVRDASELASLPMWKGMHPAAAQSYYDRLAEALRNESGSVMGFAGYEIEVVGTSGVERSSQPTTPAKPYVSDADIKAFVNANLGSPGKIASAMREHGISFDRIEEATGYSRKQIVDYVMGTSCQELIALL